MSQHPPVFRLIPGSRPLIVSMPHAGTRLPPELAQRMTEHGRAVPDTDWHMEALYGFAREMGASLLVAEYSRYVIDLNRPPDGQNLYPGQDTTGLCPVDTFLKQPIYLPGQEPTEEEIAQRLQRWWRPYHEALQAELQRLRAEHGTVALWDAHSICSQLPRFFEGKLPDLNLGTADGASCAPQLAERVHALARQAEGYTSVLNGRFKGGYITRRYGDPTRGIHAIQLEMAYCAYMGEEPPYPWMPERAAGIQPHLKAMLQACLDFVEGR